MTPTRLPGHGRHSTPHRDTERLLAPHGRTAATSAPPAPPLGESVACSATAGGLQVFDSDLLRVHCGDTLVEVYSDGLRSDIHCGGPECCAAHAADFDALSVHRG